MARVPVRRLLLATLYTALASACVVAGPVTPSSTSKPAAGGGAKATPRPGQALIAGKVLAPAGMVAAGAGNLVGSDGGSLIGPDGASIVAAGGGNYRHLAVQEKALGGVEVFLTDATGNPLPG